MNNPIRLPIRLINEDITRELGEVAGGEFPISLLYASIERHLRVARSDVSWLPMMHRLHLHFTVVGLTRFGAESQGDEERRNCREREREQGEQEEQEERRKEVA